MSESNKLTIFISLLSKICIGLVLSSLVPVSIRYLLLPTSIYKHYPLNVVFKTCEDDLHSICSFPSATLNYEKAELFSQNVYYYIDVNVKFADIEASNKLGLFQNVISLYDEQGNSLRQYTKSTYVKQPGFFIKVVWIAFLPFYLFGFFHDYSKVQIPITMDYIESIGSESVKLVYTLQNKFANVEEAEIIVTARFGLIRHFLYYWPATSSFILFFSTFIFITFMLTAKFIYFNFGSFINCENSLDENLTHIDSIDEDKQKVPIKKEENLYDGFAPDEYIPDNVDEVPKNEFIHNIGALKNDYKENNSIRQRRQLS